MTGRLMILIFTALIVIPSAVAAGNQDKPKRYVGAFTADEVLEHSDEYADAVFMYIPDAEALAIFKAVAQPVTIKVFYRTDCIDSIHHVPPFIKTVQLAGNEKINVEYIGVNMGKDEPSDLLAGWNIQRVPTFIVLRGGEEVGRVIETPEIKIEVDLAKFLKAFVD